MKKRNFLHYPEYPGGKEEFKRYISDNLIYPEEAIREKVSGTVWLSAEIDDNGMVKEVLVDKGLGYGCDDESVRLISEMKYGRVTNRGVRLRVRHRFRIRFDLNSYLNKADQDNPHEAGGTEIVYSYKPSDHQVKSMGKNVSQGQAGPDKNQGTTKSEVPWNTSGQSFTWSITISSQPEEPPES